MPLKSSSSSILVDGVGGLFETCHAFLLSSSSETIEHTKLHVYVLFEFILTIKAQLGLPFHLLFKNEWGLLWEAASSFSNTFFHFFLVSVNASLF